MFENKTSSEQFSLELSILGLDFSAKLEMKSEEKQELIFSPNLTENKTRSLPSQSLPQNRHRAIFIDIPNLYKSAQEEGLWVNNKQLYYRLTKDVSDISEVVGVFAYLITTSGIPNKNVEELKQIGYQVRARNLKPRINDFENHKPKDIDASLAFDLGQSFSSIDTVVLVSGDSDYAYGLQKLKEEHQKRIELFYLSENSLSQELMRLADKSTPIASLPGVCRPRSTSKKPAKCKVA